MATYSLPCIAILFSIFYDVSTRYANDDAIFVQYPDSKNLIKPTFDSKNLPNDNYKPKRRGNSAQLEFMQKLFYQFKEDISSLKGGNTVKSFRPIIEKDYKCGGHNGLMFWLDSLEPDDQLVHAYLHFYRPQRFDYHKSVLWKSKNLEAKALFPFKVEAISDCNLAVKLNRSGNIEHNWTSFDVKEFLQGSLNNNRSTLLFKISHNDKPLSESQLMHLLRHQLPFLTVFTNSAVIKRKIGPFELPISETDHTRLKRTKRDVQNYPENDRRPNRRRYSKKRQADGATYYSYDVTENRTPSKTRPLVPKLRAQFRTFRPAGPKMLTPRKQKSRLRKFPYYDPSDPMMGFGKEKLRITKPNRMPLSSATRLPFDDVSKINEINLDTADQDNDLTKCKRRSLKIDFRDIGWSKWIIAPEFFEAGYCDGSCERPLSKDTNPSNHALMQSLLRASSPANSHLPQPCCAPDSMDSLTLLYYDENDNVVLKNYPNMIINSCGCM
ncbi:transforming growth factor beta like domain-containing protein [Ditylenchus destructor]|nr:transforming growth factor beta like domain-containing protein [Ditylenchus destructor]